MLREELIARTGYTPTDAEYKAIEEDYYKFDGDKDAFCKAFDVEAFRATQEPREIAEMCRKNEAMKAELTALREDVAETVETNEMLKAALEKEQEWTPCDGAGTNMEQDVYESLVRGGSEMTDAEAKTRIHDNFGFDTELVDICHEAATMEVNRHHRMRFAETFLRPPIYEATDWNYVRFNVRNKGSVWRWEVVNGELLQYII